MPPRVCLETLLTLHGPVDFPRRYARFLHEAVREHRCDAAVKEVENPVILPAIPNPQFVDPVAEQVGFRPAQPLQA